MPLRPPVTEKDHLEGNPSAKIELVEYGDYECPHCGRAYGIIKNLQAELGDQLKLIFRNFPLDNIHPNARAAAIATEAAARQGKFWEMHDIIFENQEALEKDDIISYAKELDLNVEQFETDWQDQQLHDKVENDFESGARSGVNATPTFFINGEKYNNGWEADRMISWMREQGLV